MDFETVMADLESMGTEQNRKVYRRRGAGENQFGVSFANLKSLARRIKKDHVLAEALWRTGNADARCLATMVVDPAAMSSADLDRWAGDVEAARYYVLADMVASNVAAPAPQASDTVERWTRSDLEYVAQTGWVLLGVLAMKDASLPDDYFEPFLEAVETRIHQSKNRVRHAMNGALIAIGLRKPALRARAEAIAARIGKVRVDHGDTGCKTPDAASYIARSWARKKVAT